MAAALSRAEFDARGLRSGGLCLSSAAGCRGGYPRFKPSNAFESASTPQWFPLSVIRYHLDTQPVTRWYLMLNSAFATWNDTRTGLSCFQFLTVLSGAQVLPVRDCLLNVYLDPDWVVALRCGRRELVIVRQEPGRACAEPVSRP